MKRTTKQAVDVLGGLLAERRKYEHWIAALEAKKDATPPHVYERVHGDYLARLDGVLAELTARSNELEVQREALKTRITELEQEEQARRDERAEAELRHAVGEYTPDQWTQFVRDNDNALGKAGAERARLAAELESLIRIMSGLSSGSHVAVDEEDEEEDAAPADASGRGRAKTPQKSGEKFDELAFLKSVVPEGDARAKAEADKRGEGRESRDKETTTGEKPAIASKRPTPGTSGKSLPAVPAPETASATAGRASDIKEPPLDTSALPVRSTRGSGAINPGTEDVDNLAEPKQAPEFLQDVPQEAPKTLKCAECGTMNYATEWYCERCGAELAAL